MDTYVCKNIMIKESCLLFLLLVQFMHSFYLKIHHFYNKDGLYQVYSTHAAIGEKNLVVKFTIYVSKQPGNKIVVKQ